MYISFRVDPHLFVTRTLSLMPSNVTSKKQWVPQVSKIVGPARPRLCMPFWEVDLSSRFGSDISEHSGILRSWRLMASVLVSNIVPFAFEVSSTCLLQIIFFLYLSVKSTRRFASSGSPLSVLYFLDA